MTHIIPSSKVGSDRFGDLQIEPEKVFTKVDARLLGESLQNLNEVANGFSLAGNEGAGQVNDLSIITANNTIIYKENLTKDIQALISARNLLEVDNTSTANAIILKKRKISTKLAPDNKDYTKEAPLPPRWEQYQYYTFIPTAVNTGATTVQIQDFEGITGAKSLVDEAGAELVGGELQVDKVVEIYTKTFSTVQKFVLRKQTISPATTSTSGSVQLATNAEVLAGVNTSKAITPSGLFAGLVNSKTTNGYTYLPNGLILQWATFTATYAHNSSQTATFPIAFPNACLSVNVGSPTTNDTANIGVTSQTVSGFTFQVKNYTGNTNSYTVRYYAIGH